MLPSLTVFKNKKSIAIDSLFAVRATLWASLMVTLLLVASARLVVLFIYQLSCPHSGSSPGPGLDPLSRPPAAGNSPLNRRAINLLSVKKVSTCPLQPPPPGYK